MVNLAYGKVMKMAIERTKAAVGHLDKEDLPVLIEGGISRLDMSKLGAPLSNKVLALEKKLQVELKHVAESEIGAGRVLLQIQELLAPLKLFVLYLNKQPWMSVATAYRYIRIYKRAQSDPKLSPAVVEIAAAQGVPLFADSEKRPYGKLTEAVAAMPVAPKDTEGAAKWLFQLRVKQKELAKPRTVLSPLDRLSQAIVGAFNKQLYKEESMDWKEYYAELTRRCEVLVKRLTREREAA